MAASRMVEYESATSTRRTHSHNGYYAGDVCTPRHTSRATGSRKHHSAATITPVSPLTGS